MSSEADVTRTREISVVADFIPPDDQDDEGEENLAQINLQALVIATMAYLDREGLSIDHWIEGVGSIFANHWVPEEFTSSADVLHEVLRTYRSFGATIDEVDTEAIPATATISGFPDIYLCELFGMSPHVVARHNKIVQQIATAIGYDLTWRYEEELLHLTVAPHLPR